MNTEEMEERPQYTQEDLDNAYEAGFANGVNSVESEENEN